MGRLSEEVTAAADFSVFIGGDAGEAWDAVWVEQRSSTARSAAAPQ